jgi:predicted alpha/beta-hydrolase family hydrolase
MAWNLISFQAWNVDSDVLKSGTEITVFESGDMIRFNPVKKKYVTELIFYPGALVDPEAYAPLARKIAGHGYAAGIVKMPLRMARWGHEKIKGCINLGDTAKKFVLAGHSLGGVMAGQFVHENPGLIDGLILIGTSHPRDIDLSYLRIPVMKIYGTEDGLASVEEIEMNKNKLPALTQYVLLKGANHAQFGYYGSQLGDNRAMISRAEQLEKTAESILHFLKEFK